MLPPPKKKHGNSRCGKLCMCERDRERETMTDKNRERKTKKLMLNSLIGNGKDSKWEVVNVN